MSKLTKLGARRLLKLATILDTATGYRQDYWTHDCGTPACALGHWAAHNSRRWHFEREGAFGRQPRIKGSDLCGSAISDAMAEFGLSDEEADNIFSYNGCNYAKTAKQAAKYIRSFVARKGVA